MLVLLDGFTAGFGEDGVIGGVNGLGSEDTLYSQCAIGPGGGYFSFGTTLSTECGNYQGWFGLGGCWSGHNGYEKGKLYWSTAGSGGTAGKGGNIKYSSTSIINSYNGNRITEDDFNYDTVCYEYDKDGNLLDEASETPRIANVVSFINDANKKIIPTKIFIQDGIRRKVYDNLCYMSEERKKQYGVDGDISQDEIKNTSKSGAVKCVRIIEENTSMTHSRQGIGSGAGYIELDNGTFEQIENP